MSGDAGNVNNGAAASPKHCRDFMLHRTEKAPNINIKGLSILFFGDLIQRTRDFNTGIVVRYFGAEGAEVNNGISPSTRVG